MSQHVPLPISVQTIYLGAGVPVTSVSGEIDISTDQVILNEVTTHLAARPRLFVLDLTEVIFMGSAGLHVVLRTHEDAAAQGSALAVVADDCYARRVLALSGMDRVLQLYRDVPAALQALH